MKKLFFLLIIPFLALACEGPAGPPGEPTNFFVDYYTIGSRDWKILGNDDDFDSYLISPVIRIPELTSYVYDVGVVMAYVEFDDGVQAQLPFIKHYGRDIGNGEEFWTHTFDFDYSQGEVVFYLKPSNFLTGFVPPTMTFKVAFLW